MNRLSLWQLLSLTALGLALGMISATLEPGLLGAQVLRLAPDRRNTVLGLTTFVGLIVAMVTQPIMGTLSDRMRSRWGRRIPFFLAGTIGAIFALTLVAFAPGFIFLLGGVIALQISTNTIQGPWQALIPDQVPDRQLGLASGLKLLWEGTAAVVGRLIAGQILAREPEWGIWATTAVIAVPALVLLITLAVTVISLLTARNIVPASEAPASHSARRALVPNLRELFTIDLRAYPAFGWWFLNRLLFWGALIAVGVYLLFFAIDVVGLSEAQAQGYIGQVSAVLGGALLLIAIPASRIADRVPRKPLVIAAGILASAGTVVVLITRELWVITFGGAIIGAGAGLYLIASWALITEIVPKAEAARYLGVANIASAGGSALARVVGGTLIDAVNAAGDSRAVGYFSLYALAAGLFFLSAFAVLPLNPHPQRGEKTE